MSKTEAGAYFLKLPRLFTQRVADCDLDIFTLGLKTIFAPRSLSPKQLIRGITNLSVGAVALGMGAAAAGAAIGYAKKAGSK